MTYCAQSKWPSVRRAPAIWSSDAWYVDQRSPSRDLLKTLLGVDPVIRSFKKAITVEPMVKVMIGGTATTLDPRVVRAMHRFFEIGPPGITKREAMLFVLKRTACGTAEGVRVW